MLIPRFLNRGLAMHVGGEKRNAELSPALTLEQVYVNVARVWTSFVHLNCHLIPEDHDQGV